MVDQDRICHFAETHGEDQRYTHVDPESPKDSPFEGTIARGRLALSLLTPI